jgi:hypothetical protein
LDKWAKKSLILTIVHFVIIGIFFILMFTIGNVPGVMHPVLIPFFVYMFFSIIIPIGVITISIIGLNINERKLTHIICMILSIIYIVAFISFIIIMWPRWMSI